MHDVMIDLENLSVEPNGPVLTIGMVQFDIHTGEIGQEFYARMDRKLAMKYGLASLSTLQWWESQDPAARAEAYDGKEDPRDVARNLRDWFARVFPKSPFVWGNGSVMDIAQLEWWLRQTCPVQGKYGHEYPWKYWDIMDMRTIMRVAKLRMPKTRPAHVQHHNALHDARYQVEWVVKAMAACRRAGGPLPPPGYGLPPMPEPPFRVGDFPAPPQITSGPASRLAPLTPGEPPPPLSEADYAKYNRISAD